MRKLITSAFTLVLILPFAASAQSSSDLQSQAQALLQQVQALQAQLAGDQSGASAQGGSAVVTSTNGTVYNAVTGSSIPVAGSGGVNSSACPNIGRVLKSGSTGDDVARLQQFLARDRSVYPEAMVTGYYGALTQAAVQRWQTKFNIVSSGTPASTGFGVVGPRTAAAIALLCSTGSSATSAASPVGGFIQVSPISGNAPLIVNVQATVNTTNSCVGAIYMLNWGDSSNPISIPVSANNCGQVNQTYQHTYSSAGTYQVTLSAGAHQTSATVSVFGTSASLPPNTNTNPPPSGSGGLPAETFVASASSGTAPLTVAFTGVVTSADAGWCAGGCSDAIVFGDGSTGSVPLPGSQGSYQNYSISHTYQSAGTYTAMLYQGSADSSHSLVGSIPITVAAGVSPYTYNAIQITPNVGNNPLAVTLSFDLPSSCTGYDIDWGDGYTHTTQGDGGTSCGQNSVIINAPHTYSGSGAYTIIEKRGANLSRVDTVGITISN